MTVIIRELKACPFCGSLNIDAGSNEVRCENCDATIQTMSLDEGIDWWNDRAVAPQLTAREWGLIDQIRQRITDILDALATKSNARMRKVTPDDLTRCERRLITEYMNGTLNLQDLLALDEDNFRFHIHLIYREQEMPA